MIKMTWFSNKGSKYVIVEDVKTPIDKITSRMTNRELETIVESHDSMTNSQVKSAVFELSRRKSHLRSVLLNDTEAVI